MKKYVLNPKTGKLHIAGYCPHSKSTANGYLLFDTEDEARSYGSPCAVGMCKICLKKRDEIDRRN